MSEPTAAPRPQPRITPSKPAPQTRTASAAAAPDDALNLRELVSVVRRNWWVVLASAGLATSLAGYFAYTAPPKFRAKAVIKLANSRQAMAGNLSNENSQTSVGLYSDPLRSQMQVLTSRKVAAAVVDSEPSLLRLRVVGQPGTLLKSVEVAPDTPVDSVRLTFLSDEVTAAAIGQNRRARYGSPVVLPGLRFTVAARPAVSEALLQVVSRDAATGALAGALKATQRAESDVIDVEYTGPDPLATQRVVNTVVRVFTAMSAESAHQQSRLRRDFIEQQLVQNDSLEASAQGTLAAFRARENMFSTKDRFTSEERDAVSLGIQRSGLASNREVAQSLVDGVVAAKGTERASAVRTLVSTPGINANPVVSQLYAQLVRFQSSRDSMTTGRFASAAGNPDVQRLDTLIEATQTQLVDAARSQIGALNAQIKVLDQARAKSNSSLKLLPSTAAEELRLESQVSSIHKVGEQLREEYQKAKIAEAVQGGEVEIVDFAAKPVSLAGARGPKLLIGLLVGLVLGIGAAFVREHMNTTIKRREDVGRVLRLSSVGVIPAFEKSAKRRNGPHRNGKGASNGNGDHPKPAGAATSGIPRDALSLALGIEAFASLRTNLLYYQSDRNLQTIVVTSSAPKDGKSTVSANMAKAFARFGARVLLVDCDLRRPRLHEEFGEPLANGLSDVLLGTASLGDSLRKVSGATSMLLLTAGTRVENPSELLAGDAMRVLLRTLAEKFTLVVLDSPPVLVVSDAVILATQSDGVLFVLRAGTTEPEVARAALGQLDAVGARVIGAVLNDPDNRLPRYDGGYYYKYYNDYFAKANT